jgi:branched-chain amino acid transport system substrate-binding protein
MPTSRYWQLLAIIITTLLPLTPLVASPEPHRGDITLGGIFCLTGEVASGCNAIREGAEVGLEVVNASGGINGRSLRLDIQDSHFNPRDAHTLAKRFSANRDVLGVLITGIIEAKAAAPALERNRIPYLTLWDSAPAIEALGEYSFGIGPWLPSTYELSAEFSFSTLRARRAAVFATTSEWSLSVAAGFKAHFAKLGGSIVGYEESAPNESDFRTVLTRILRTKPEVIYAPITAHLVPFFRQLSQLGYTGKVITSDNLTEDHIAQDPKIFEGILQTMVADPNNPEAERLKSLYRERFAEEPTMLAFHSWGYDGVRLMAHALRDSLASGRPLRDALLLIQNFPGAGGSISFSPEGSWRMPLKVFVVRGGRFVGRE